MNRKTVEHVPPHRDARYSDLWSDSRLKIDAGKDSRASELLHLLSVSQNERMFQFHRYHGQPLVATPLPATICDVGSGIGGVTLTYRRLLPEAKIVSVDVDSRAQLEAKASGATAFLESDVLQMEKGDWDQLTAEVGGESFDHVVALKTKGEVALHLLQARETMLPSSVLFFSLIQECDKEFCLEINKILRDMDPLLWRRFFIYEGRNFHEEAWVVLPH